MCQQNNLMRLKFDSLKFKSKKIEVWMVCYAILLLRFPCTSHFLNMAKCRGKGIINNHDNIETLFMLDRKTDKLINRNVLL